jgi:hypothetical protein
MGHIRTGKKNQFTITKYTPPKKWFKDEWICIKDTHGRRKKQPARNRGQKTRGKKWLKDKRICIKDIEIGS